MLHSLRFDSAAGLAMAVDTEPLLTAREVAGMLGLSIVSVLRRWRAGDLPDFRLSQRLAVPSLGHRRVA
jgi:hypothetical protein